MSEIISYIIDKLFQPDIKYENDVPIKDMVILDHIEKINEISRKSGVKKSLEKGNKHLDFITKNLCISPLQAVILFHIIRKSNDSIITIDSIHCSL